MVKSKSIIERQLKRKRNSFLVETILAGKKNEKWLEVSGLISGPRRKRIDVNLDDLNGFKNSGKIVVPGKVLSQGNVEKKMEIIALGFSEKAKEKLLKKGCEVKTILEEIKSNPSAEGIKIFRK